MNWHLLECGHYAANADVIVTVSDTKPTGCAECHTCADILGRERVSRRMVKLAPTISQSANVVPSGQLAASRAYIDARYGNRGSYA